MVRVLKLQLLAAALTGLLLTTTLRAQEENEKQEVVEIQQLEVVEGQAAGPFLIGDATEGKMLGAKQFQLNQIFSLEIKRIDSICKLENSQKSKLQVGAKGVIKRLVDEFRKNQMVNNIFGLVGENDNDRDAESDDAKIEIEEVNNFEDVDNYVWQIVDMGNGPDELFTAQRPTENPMWVKIVQSTLSPDQHQAYIAFQNQQQAAQRQAMLDLGIQQLTSQLALNADQAQAIRPLIEKQMTKFERVPPIYASFQFLFAASSVSPADAKKILDENQFNYFQILTAPMKDMVAAVEAAEQAGDGGAQEDKDDDDE